MLEDGEGKVSAIEIVTQQIEHFRHLAEDESALASHPDLTQKLVQLFKFDRQVRAAKHVGRRDGCRGREKPTALGSFESFFLLPQKRQIRMNSILQKSDGSTVRGNEGERRVTSEDVSSEF